MEHCWYAIAQTLRLDWKCDTCVDSRYFQSLVSSHSAIAIIGRVCMCVCVCVQVQVCMYIHRAGTGLRQQCFLGPALCPLLAR